MTEIDPPLGLPPRPDSQTGLPRPPHAPNFAGNRKPIEDDASRESALSRKPEPPPGQGPVLAWYRASWRGSIVAGIGGFVFLSVLFVVLSLVKAGDLSLLKYWFFWLLAALAALGIAASTKVARCSAGADWLKLKKSWVKTYELTEIKTQFLSNTIYVYLTDKDGRKIDEQINTLQQDRLIWDLLYNGVRHSIASGAELKGTARTYFSE
ncbi:MAG TPA: hypothetical protein VGN81_16915 [Pseudonocardiaceae bacterium]|jgi:hypothetical protein